MYNTVKTAKRRFVQAAKEKTGVAVQTLDDYAFETHTAEFQAIKPQLESLLRYLTDIKHNISGLGRSCEGFVTITDQENSVLSRSSDSGLFANAMVQMQKTCNSEKVETNLQQAIDSIQQKLQPFKQVERLIKTRDGLKVDYESFKRKLDAVNEKIAAGTLSQVPFALPTVLR